MEYMSIKYIFQTLFKKTLLSQLGQQKRKTLIGLTKNFMRIIRFAMPVSILIGWQAGEFFYWHRWLEMTFLVLFAILFGAVWFMLFTPETWFIE